MSSIPTSMPSMPTNMPSMPTNMPTDIINSDTNLLDASGSNTIDASGTVTGLMGKLDLTKNKKIDPLDEKITGSSPLNLNADPNYLTHFCKNRNSVPPNDIKNPFKFITEKMKPDTWIPILVVGVPLLLFLIWCFFKYYDLALPFAGGIFNILKFFIIYIVIIIVMRFFFKFLFTFKFWITLFMKYLKLFMNPLLNDKVSSAYCYFTSYVNWLIYYPAKIYYFICLLGISFIFFLIIIPIIVCISFVIGYLFSLLGDSSSAEKLIDNMKKAASSVTINTVKPSDLVSQAPDILSKVPGMLSQAPDLLKKVPDMLRKGPDILDSLKYKELPPK
jgi:hypothetical protein